MKRSGGRTRGWFLVSVTSVERVTWTSLSNTDVSGPHSMHLLEGPIHQCQPDSKLEAFHLSPALSTSLTAFPLDFDRGLPCIGTTPTTLDDDSDIKSGNLWFNHCCIIVPDLSTNVMSESIHQFHLWSFVMVVY